MGEIWDKVKVLHSSELKTWTRFPEYRDHHGPTLAEYRARRQRAEAALSEFEHLIEVRDKLAALDVDTPTQYAVDQISIPRSLLPGRCEVVLPAPAHPGTTITCDAGEVSGTVLRVPRSWRKRTVSIRYACASRVLNADEIARLKDIWSGAGVSRRAKLAEAEADRYRQSLLFISHRWHGSVHPDPDGEQLAKLRTLENCFLIYDYVSFPQNATAPEDERMLREVLNGMNALISNVVVLESPDFLERGWCIYEYIVASMRASIVCDEFNAPDFVTLRNLAATKPPVDFSLKGHSIESTIQNSKNQGILETINAILPLFSQSKFTKESDRETVKDLLLSELVLKLPPKMEYIPYVGEWKQSSWTKDELAAAFTSELKWERLQKMELFAPFEPKVPSTLADAVANGYRLDRMPPQNDWTWMSLVGGKALGGFGTALVKALFMAALGLGGLLLLVIALVIWLIWRFVF